MTKSSTIQILLMKKAAEKYSNPEKQMEYITKRRKEELKPKFEKLLSQLEEIEPRNKGKYSMSKAIQYVLNNKEGLKRRNYGIYK